MADEKNKGQHPDQQTTKPGKSKSDELSDKDLERAAGGLKWTATKH
ncbi:MAG TPA: hypothetical protein VMO17_06260 [Terriglobia bacterium]|nr:hypothetical protein [Terriglobia bacterium]